MPRPGHSSRQQYRQYYEQRKAIGNHRYRPSAGDVPVARPRATPRSPSSFKLLSEFFGLLTGFRTTLAVVLGALAVSSVLGLIPLYGTKIVFDYVLTDHPLPAGWHRWIDVPDSRQGLLTWVAAAMIGFALASLMIGIWSRWQATRITKRVQVAVRRKVFEHASRLPLHRVYELKSGGVASILREDAGGVAELVFALLYNPWRAIIQLLGCLTILTLTDWRLLLGSLVLLPSVYLTHRTWISRIRPLWRDIRATREQIDARATEAFSGMRVVRSFSRQKAEAAQFTRKNHLMARQELAVWWWSRAIDITWSILIPVASAGLLWYGGLRILDGMRQVKAGTLSFEEALTVGDLVMFLSYLAALLLPLATLAASATTLQNSLAGLDRVLDILAEPTEMPSLPGNMIVNPQRVTGRLTLREVGFTYPRGSLPVLEEVNLEVEPGQMIALVGPSGAGKTTLCNLIARFYDPTLGRIELDGIDLRHIQVDSYRRLLGIVEQDVFLFDGTVAQNIGYGRRGATDAQITQAAELANAHEFIADLPEGYDTWIGERGVKLSGGQRQRLAIARAILADPRLLILDEATSNLDTESERLIQMSLQTLMAGRTSFVIAHRLSTVIHASRIIVLEHGRIIEQGPHDDLMARNGRYRQMVELQTQPQPRNDARQ